MTKIFISYRRADTQYVTDSIYEHMCRHFGQENVFLDVGSIPFGVDYRQYLRDQIAAHDVILVIIGPDWGRIMEERTEETNDFVRIEIENALRMEKLVIPVLVMEARMPNFARLPPSISDLQWLNSANVRRQPDLSTDCQRLADGIRAFFANSRRPTMLRSKLYDLLPMPFTWIDIPAGRVTLEAKKGFYGGGQTFEVPAFTIAKYPITNDQFAKFIDAGGYTERKWWSETGWKTLQQGWYYDGSSGGWEPPGKPWHEPAYWSDSNWNSAEQPVVGVSWHEAQAFCQWLSETSGEPIRLPTETQWQWAAQGNDSRLYPWGDDWNAGYCNSQESGIGKTTPIARYEGKGDSPFGVVDMVGNAWEWCVTDPTSGSHQTHAAAGYVLRGGSWSNSNHYARTTTRYGFDPYFRLNLVGFRIIRAALSKPA